MKVSSQLVMVVVCAALLACGTPGAPRPPSLQLPRPVDDLTAARKGDHVTLTWTPSSENTDGTLVRRPGPTRVCRGVNDFPMTTCLQAVADLSINPAPLAKGQEPKVTFTDTLPKDLEERYPTGLATYAVEMLNRRGRSAGLSNQVRAPLAPTLPPPPEVKAQATPDGVLLSWNLTIPVAQSPPFTHFYRVYRRLEGAPADVLIGEVQPERQPTLLDRSFEWQKTYFYRVTVVTTVWQDGKQLAQVEGDDSPTVTISVRDTFPPAQPVGLQAVFSGVGQTPFIDLTWASNQEPDLAGYNVYRRENGGEWVRLNRELVKAPAFRDTDVAPGHTYYYSVSAVDLRNNESPKSEPASETVPSP